jgi:hypothetical protein
MSVKAPSAKARDTKVWNAKVRDTKVWNVKELDGTKERGDTRAVKGCIGIWMRQKS